jgi:hypothetical protein
LTVRDGTMAKVHDDGDLTKNYRFEATSDRRGLWKGWQEFSCQKDRVGVLLPYIGSSWELFPFMAVTDRQIVGTEGGMCRVRVNYEGANTGGGAGGGGGPVEVYSLRVTLSEEPITTHPRYDDLDDADIVEAYELATNPPREKDGKSLKEIDTSGWDPLKIELFEDVQKGIEAYRDPKVSWVKKWVDDQLPTNLNDIGEISTPEGDPPTVAAGRNWLFTGLQSDERGGVYELEATWELSGKGGWNTRYYQD